MIIALADLAERYGESELIRRTGRGSGQIDPTMINRAIADAEAEIAMYLATRYTLPITPTPAVLQRLACDITRYRLYEDQATEEVRQRYEDAIRDLKAIATGLISLGPEMVATEPSPGAVFVDAPDRVFSEARLADY